ncbi:MAG: hypothetical protein AAFQ43_05485 [Bacteroidota bacterium]
MFSLSLRSAVWALLLVLGAPTALAQVDVDTPDDDQTYDAVTSLAQGAQTDAIRLTVVR